MGKQGCEIKSTEVKVTEGTVGRGQREKLSYLLIHVLVLGGSQCGDATQPNLMEEEIYY